MKPRSSECEVCGKKLGIGGVRCISCIAFEAQKKIDAHRREENRKRRAKLKFWHSER